MTEKKSLSKKNVNSNKPMGQESVPLATKVIATVILLALAGCTIFWYVAKGKLQAMETAMVKHFEEKGFVIEKEALTFSGFPFSVKAHLPKLKVTRGEGKGTSIMLQGEPVELSIAPWRPSRVTVTGPLTYGAYMGGSPVLSLKVGRVRADITLSKDSKVEVAEWKLYDVEVLKGEMDQKLASIAEFSLKNKEKVEGDLTRFMVDCDLEKVDFGGAGVPVVLDALSLGGSIATPYKSMEDLSSAVQDFNKTFNEDLKKRCEEKAEYMPSLKVLMHAIEDSKSHADIHIGLKGSDYDVSLKLEGSVKDAFPHLIFTADLKNVDKLLDSVVETGLLSPSVARASTLFLGNVGTMDEKTNSRRIEIRLEEKILKMGEKTLWEFKDFDWETIKLPAQYCSYMMSNHREKESEALPAGSLAGLAPVL